MALAGFVFVLVVAATWIAPLWPKSTVEIQTIIGGIGCAFIFISLLNAVAGPVSDPPSRKAPADPPKLPAQAGRPPRRGLPTARQARRARSARAGWAVLFHQPARARFVSVTLTQLGVRIDNLLPSCAMFLAVTAGLIAPAMIWTRSGSALPFPPGELPRYFLWALFQQFVAVGAFWFPFRRAMGLPVNEAASFSREVAVATAAALVFAVAHAPNPGLMVLGGVAELVWLSLFGRFRNLFALSLAHGFAALVASHHLVPSPWLTSMRVGLSYWKP